MDWTHLKNLDRTQVSVHFGRTEPVTQSYQLHQAWLKAQGLTMTDYILRSLFNGPVKSSWRLVLNRFPYNLAPGIEHWVFWIHPESGLSLAEAEQNLERELIEGRGYTRDEFIYFQNILIKRSVPGIEHYHVFIRR